MNLGSNGNDVNETLKFNGMVIRDQQEMLCLTDMWKASGADPARQPSNWLASADAKRFIEALDFLEPGNSGVQTSRGGRGIGGSTWAHWQIGLAYAKYLSPDFHMWCNTVVRQHMEGMRSGVFSLDERGIALVEAMVDAKVKRELPAALAAYFPNGTPDGVTAGEVCHLSRIMTTYPKGVASRVSHRLTEFCRYHKQAPHLARLGRVKAQVFPTNLARTWLDTEGRILIRRWVDEKNGQGRLKLV